MILIGQHPVFWIKSLIYINDINISYSNSNSIIFMHNYPRKYWFRTNWSIHFPQYQRSIICQQKTNCIVLIQHLYLSITIINTELMNSALSKVNFSLSITPFEINLKLLNIYLITIWPSPWNTDYNRNPFCSGIISNCTL